jgi:putative sterol carrier protein
MTALELLKMYIIVANSVCSVSEGQAVHPTVTLTMADDTLMKTMTGKLNPMMAFMSGKLNATGDLVALKRRLRFSITPNWRRW